MLNKMKFNIEELLKKKKMSLKELCYLVDLNQEDIEVYTKEDNFRITALYKIAKVLDVTIDDLFVVEGEFNPIRGKEVDKFTVDYKNYLLNDKGDALRLVKQLNQFMERDERKVLSLLSIPLRQIEAEISEISEDIIKRVIDLGMLFKNPILIKKYNDSFIEKKNFLVRLGLYNKIEGYKKFS